MPMIEKLLGHTQVQTTARYAHLAVDPLKLAVNYLSYFAAHVAHRQPIGAMKRSK